MKKSLVALLFAAFVVMGVGIGAGTYAIFMDSDSIDGNQILTGDVEVTLDDYGTLVNEVMVDNAYPGWTGSQLITVTNAGTLPLDFALSFEFEGTLPVELQYSLDGVTWAPISEVEFDSGIDLAVGDYYDVVVQYRIEWSDLNQNHLENSTFTFDIVVDAEQAASLTN